MVTKIVNDTDCDVSYSVKNAFDEAFSSELQNKRIQRIQKVAKAHTITYDRCVTGDDGVEKHLAENGCVLSQVRRNLIISIAGADNAVGCDETPLNADEVKPLPYCYFESQKPNRGGYNNADAIPRWNPLVDTYQDMQGVGIGARTKGLHYEIAKRLITLIPDGFELEIWGNAMCDSGMCVGEVGSVNSSNLPENSTKWGADGSLTIATGRRFNIQFGKIQPESKFLGFVWCQAAKDGAEGVSVDDYSASFQAMVDKIQNIFETGSGVSGGGTTIDTASKMAYERFAINTKAVHNEKSSPENNAAFVSFTGGTFVCKFEWVYFARTNFLTNLLPNQVEIKYSYTAPTINQGDDGSALDNSAAGKAEIDFYNALVDGRVRYKSLATGWSKNWIYACFVNKLNNKYMGYVILNWTAVNAGFSPNFDYTEDNIDRSFDIGYPLWIAFPDPQAYWNTQGTFADIIARQKEKIGFFLDLPQDLETNDCTPQGTHARAWNYWNGYGCSGSAKKSQRYGQGAYKYIAQLVFKQIEKMLAKYGKPALED